MLEKFEWKSMCGRDTLRATDNFFEGILSLNCKENKHVWYEKQDKIRMWEIFDEKWKKKWYLLCMGCKLFSIIMSKREVISFIYIVSI